MDKAALVTYLAEIIFLPEALLQNFVSFNQLDFHRVEARIEYKGLKACGIYHFNDAHEMIYFSTDERGQSSSDGSIENIPWEKSKRLPAGAPAVNRLHQWLPWSPTAQIGRAHV